MKSPKAPATPDFAALANQQENINQKSFDRSHYDQSNPYGSMSWDKTPDGRWSSSVNLNPNQQYLFNQGESAQKALASKSPQYAEMVSNYLMNPLETGEGVRSRVEGELLGKLNTQSDRDLESTRARLLNQGVTENSEAWRRAMNDFDVNRQNSRSTALLNAGTEASRQAQLSSGLRSQYLNELSGLLGQSKAAIPNYGSGMSQAVPGADQYGAAQDAYAGALQNYNAKVAQQGQLYGAAGQLGGAGLIALSDARLKSNIVKVGSDDRGFNIYEYNIQDRKERGVLAQEIEGIYPEAVVTIDGIKHVNYGAIGVNREVLNG